MNNLNRLFIFGLITALLVNCAVQPVIEADHKKTSQAAAEHSIEVGADQKKAVIFTNQDLDGNGIFEKVVVETNKVKVYQDGSGPCTIYSTGNKQVLSFRQLDDLPGKEIWIKKSKSYLVISYRKNIQQEYPVTGNNVLLHQELDGHEGDEAVIIQTNKTIKVISFRTNHCHDYSTGTWNTILYQDLDDAGGKEIVVLQRDNTIRVISFQGNYYLDYSIGAWKTILYQDLDDAGGKEIVVLRRDKTIKVISFRDNFYRDYPVGDWKTVQYHDLDGISGKEIVVVQVNKIMKTICFKTNQVKDYPIGTWSVMQQRELDGQPGLEVIFQRSNDFLIIDYAADLSQAFERPASMSYTFYDQDGYAGDELVATVPGQGKWVLNWRTKSTYYLD